jgi:CheY-like chemotaxis protein
MVIVDLGAASADALQLARAMRGRTDAAALRLVMLARHHVDVAAAHEAGFNACLVKPVRQTALYECLVNVMAGRHQDVAATEAAGDNGKAAAGNRGKVLLVEDNLINQQVALGMLQIQGCSVTVANNGIEALEAFTNETFDLVLMDCHMPEMDGFEATKEIRLREQGAGGKVVPIVALTANAMTQDREECLKAGMNDHLSKPFSMQTLQDALDRWMPAVASGGERRAERAQRIRE